jgi:hypothetical protein
MKTERSAKISSKLLLKKLMEKGILLEGDFLELKENEETVGSCILSQDGVLRIDNGKLILNINDWTPDAFKKKTVWVTRRNCFLSELKPIRYYEKMPNIRTEGFLFKLSEMNIISEGTLICLKYR